LPAKGQQADFWDAKFPAFGVRVTASGTKTFMLNIDKSRRTLGRYPVISLAEARTEARKLLAERTLGKVRPQSISFPLAVKTFLEEKRKNRRARTGDDYEYYLNRFFPFKCQVGEVGHDEVQRKLSRISKQSLYNHALAAARGFFNWCQKRRYIDDNPVRGLAPHSRPRRSRVLTDDELKAIWVACEEPGGDMPDTFKLIVKLLILMGQRRGETAGLRGTYYSHNQQTICLPPDLTKNGSEHTFPIGPMAAEILKSCSSTERDALLFPARGKALKPFSGWSKSKKLLDKASGVTGWTLHDLRRTFRTNLGKLGVVPHIAERLVNHISSQTDMERTYDLHKYLPEMRGAVVAWEDRLQALFNNSREG
jgi:integrase